MDFITSDLHFGHKDIVGEESFCKTRAHFKTTEEMNDYLIETHNSKVTNKDTIYHLGDFSINLKPREVYSLLCKMNGQIHFIKGNHDSQRILKYLNNNNYKLEDGRDKFVTYEIGTRIKRDGVVYYLSHFPMIVGRKSKVLRSLCGHIHDEVADGPNILNVGIDSPEIPKDVKFGEPLELETAINLVEEKHKEYIKRKSDIFG